MWDIIVVGAGAAGLMTAICAAREGARVLMLDGAARVGAKILMSGGTRCNVTNRRVSEKDYESEAKRSVRNILRAFSSERAVEFFKELGVELVLEPGGKYFPRTHSARTVLEALLRETKRLGVVLETDRKATGIQKRGEVFFVSGAHFKYESKTVVITTGGMSHPSTGSDGSGYKIAEALGHRLVPMFPALTPLLTEDKDLKALAGISLDARLSLCQDRKKKIAFEGGFLFTHFGFSGPTALNISRHWFLAQKENRAAAIELNFLPQEDEAAFSKHLDTLAAQAPSRLVKNFLFAKLPARLAELVLEKSQISERRAVAQFSRLERTTLVRNLFHFPLPVSGVYGYQKAEVTAGGVPLEEIDDTTMESRRLRGLYFAGEILDADGRIGGFNFQWSWSTGCLAGRAARAFSLALAKSGEGKILN